MKRINLEKLQSEVREVLRIERLIIKGEMELKDISSLKALAEKGHPRAEYDYGLYFLVCLNDFESAYAWFKKCKGHTHEY